MPRMHGHLLFAGALLAVLFSACSVQRSRAVRVSSEEEQNAAKDYHAMLNLARTRTAAEDTLGPLITGLERFRSERGRLPTNLFEMVDSGTMRAIPPPPAGAAYAYDPRNGNLRLIPVDEKGRVSVSDDPYNPPSLMKKP